MEISSPSRVVDNLLDDTAQVAVALSVVQRSKFGWGDPVLGVGREDASGLCVDTFSAFRGLCILLETTNFSGLRAKRLVSGWDFGAGHLKRLTSDNSSHLSSGQYSFAKDSCCDRRRLTARAEVGGKQTGQRFLSTHFGSSGRVAKCWSTLGKAFALFLRHFSPF